MIQKYLDELLASIPKENILLNEPMKKHTSLKIGGPAEIFINATSIENIKTTLDVVNKYNIPLNIIGNGSNILVSDKGVKGIVLKPRINKMEIQKRENYVELKVQSGAVIGAIAYKLMQNDVTGFEKFSGIPGTIGGAVRMNAGAHGKEIKDIVIATTYMDMQGNMHTITNEEHQFEYRNSIFSKEKYIIIETKLKLDNGNKDIIQEKMQKYADWRKEHQPLEFPNAGSTFKRGRGFITASVIEKCGLKGYTIGGAQVSTKHAGFVINIGNATSKDVLKLVEYIKTEVLKQTGKKIELEIQII